jgi:hypothetical protein
MNMRKGLKEISEAKWVVSHKFTCWDLKVHDSENRLVHANLALRSVYCDRGHLQLCRWLEGLLLIMSRTGKVINCCFLPLA